MVYIILCHSIIIIVILFHTIWVIQFIVGVNFYDYDGVPLFVMLACAVTSKREKKKRRGYIPRGQEVLFKILNMATLYKEDILTLYYTCTGPQLMMIWPRYIVIIIIQLCFHNTVRYILIFLKTTIEARIYNMENVHFFSFLFFLLLYSPKDLTMHSIYYYCTLYKYYVVHEHIHYKL
jgi:hypothetical protein